MLPPGGHGGEPDNTRGVLRHEDYAARGNPPVVSGLGQISGVQYSGDDFGAFRGGDSPHRFGLDAGDAIQIHGCQGRPVLDRSLPHGGVPSLIWSPPLPPL